MNKIWLNQKWLFSKLFKIKANIFWAFSGLFFFLKAHKQNTNVSYAILHAQGIIKNSNGVLFNVVICMYIFHKQNPHERTH